MQKNSNLLEGAIELHAHSAPSIFPRRQNDWELIEDVRDAGMYGIVLKAHEGVSYDRANLLQNKYPEIKIYGGLVCNHFVGGLNIHAVDLALKMGASIIWMPTLSTSTHKKYFERNKNEKILKSNNKMIDSDESISIFNGKHIKDSVKTILELIAKNNKVLATGHLNSDDAYKLVLEAKKIGVEKILIQHVDLGISPYTLTEQQQLVEEGCFLEKCYLACSNDFKDMDVTMMADTIHKLGSSKCVLVTDYGQKHNVPVVKALDTFVKELLEVGVSQSDIKKMIVENPRYLMES
ncbi:DUF6282 family protein [Jeotgalicoccus sp. ATCC 8456]|uniref:DUF6282 family protein n=1 Tax=Jeotgalicoccus sp. ATCC 8456 TaxID=946435 RepID=UPI0018E5C88C|nr:DUF6282 family protein [Jeotgalicoccus sp. ATCC 8456]QQD84802.1 hypothetical protein JEM45_09330 [Jeotgalicoccus sp. ATCC 8456]